MNPSHTRISYMCAVMDLAIMITIYSVLCISEKSGNNKAITLRASEDRQKLFGVSENPVLNDDWRDTFCRWYTSTAKTKESIECAA